ncbi:MAG: polyamine aminopropyltransferase [Nannocystaceae bacterium]
MEWFYEHYKDRSATGIRLDRLVHAEQSAYQSIKVYETVGHGRLLTLDDLVMLTELDEFVYHELLTHLPLCAHPRPERVLVVGGGDGGTVRECLRHPEVAEVVLCEIDERVTRVCQAHIPSVAGDVDDPRVTLVFADAIAYVREHPGAFDAILVDSTEPEGPAAGLFARDFFVDLRRALRPGGVISAQTESPFYAADTVRAAFTGLRTVFAEVHAYYGAIPTYPSGCWTFALASDTRTPADVDAARATALGGRYVNEGVIRGAFLLPEFIRRLVAPSTAAG